VRIKVNGEEREVPTGTTLDELVRLLALAPERLAVELNYEVVRRDRWTSLQLDDGDRVEIVHFVGGGALAETGTPPV
jgi:thiamine biosynthesis protein ThiS